MKKHLFLSALFFLFSSSVYATGGDWRVTSVHKKRMQQERMVELVKIPIYEERLQNVVIIGPVHGQDVLGSKKTAIFNQVREQAYKMQANAIMEFKCKPMLKSLFQTCEGFGVKVSE